MCGILGAFSRKNISGSRFSEALEDLSNRGPDDEGYRCLEEGENFIGEDSIEAVNMKEVYSHSSSEWFGSRRLSITGGKDCHQPMNYRNLSIVYEGEIYNYKEVREKLRKKGHSFETDGDTEVFLHAFKEWGPDALEKMEGKWSAAVYDSSREKLYCIRDHFGTKPLYYSYQDGEFYFSSKILPILRLKEDSPRINQDIKIDYLKYGLVDHSEETFFRSVEQIRPGQYLCFDGESIETEEIPRDKDAGAGIEEVCRETIESKVPESEWCITLSGGLDSSIVASVLRSDVPESYSLDIGDGKYESSSCRKEVVDRLNLQSTEVNVTVEELIESIERAMEIQEEPTASLPAQAQQVIFERISRSEAKVIITGSGADELFLGYDHFVLKAVVESLRKEGIIQGSKLLKSHISELGISGLMYVASRLVDLHPKERIKEFFGSSDGVIREPQGYTSPDMHPRVEDLDAARQHQINYSWYPFIMRSTDKNAGAYGLEAREGFLSQKLLSTVREKNPLDNFRDGERKKMLKDAFRDSIPDSVVEKKKLGFLPTDNRAYTPGVREKFNEVFDSPSFRSRDNIDAEKVIEKLEEEELEFSTAYRLYCFEIWARKFIDNPEL
jgi:asparagine synthase (glutamine-hydrolysing)